eukprot:TRINITY_DN1689_c1_g1_i13.p1 TRINITY_DN1689_c1_g1~~TRINITY_DN1689_c1_g1_i13.p1  ORF type:complete len:825 (-),score=175.61 TRINITY_DN1689_c1_g1_i13:1709-4183(-)
MELLPKGVFIPTLPHTNTSEKKSKEGDAAKCLTSRRTSAESDSGFASHSIKVERATLHRRPSNWAIPDESCLSPFITDVLSSQDEADTKLMSEIEQSIHMSPTEKERLTHRVHEIAEAHHGPVQSPPHYTLAGQLRPTPEMRSRRHSMPCPSLSVSISHLKSDHSPSLEMSPSIGYEKGHRSKSKSIVSLPSIEQKKSPLFQPMQTRPRSAASTPIYHPSPKSEAEAEPSPKISHLTSRSVHLPELPKHDIKGVLYRDVVVPSGRLSLCEESDDGSVSDEGDGFGSNNQVSSNGSPTPHGVHFLQQKSPLVSQSSGPPPIHLDPIQIPHKEPSNIDEHPPSESLARSPSKHDSQHHACVQDDAPELLSSTESSVVAESKRSTFKQKLPFNPVQAMLQRSLSSKYNQEMLSRPKDIQSPADILNDRMKTPEEKLTDLIVMGYVSPMSSPKPSSSYNKDPTFSKMLDSRTDQSEDPQITSKISKLAPLVAVSPRRLYQGSKILKAPPPKPRGFTSNIDPEDQNQPSKTDATTPEGRKIPRAPGTRRPQQTESRRASVPKVPKATTKKKTRKGSIPSYESDQETFAPPRTPLKIDPLVYETQQIKEKLEDSKCSQEEIESLISQFQKYGRIEETTNLSGKDSDEYKEIVSQLNWTAFMNYVQDIYGVSDSYFTKALFYLLSRKRIVEQKGKNNSAEASDKVVKSDEGFVEDTLEVEVGPFKGYEYPKVDDFDAFLESEDLKVHLEQFCQYLGQLLHGSSSQQSEAFFEMMDVNQKNTVTNADAFRLLMALCDDEELNGLIPSLDEAFLEKPTVTKAEFSKVRRIVVK